MARVATAKKTKTTKKAKAPKADVSKLGKKELRQMCDDLGIKWSKTKDDSASLRKKINKALAKAPAEKEVIDGFNLAERAATTEFSGAGAEVVVIDPETGKKVIPLSCYGWLYTKASEHCTKECPYAKKCKKLTAAWEKSADPEEFSRLENLAGEEAAYQEAAKEVESTQTSKKEIEEALAVKAKKAAKKKPKAKRGKGLAEPAKAPLGVKTQVEILFDEDDVLAMDDKDTRRFYRRILKRHGEDGTATVGQLIRIFERLFGDDLSRKELIGTLIKPMIEDEDIRVSE